MNEAPNLVSIKIEKDLEKAIRSKVYDVGQKLPTEYELSQRFSVSRTAIREALQSLKARGLIEIKKGSGVYVAELTTQSAIAPMNLYFEMSKDANLVKNAIKTRQLFEPEIASQAALYRTSRQLELLENNLQNLIECPTQDIQTETDVDIAFHTLITQSTGNTMVSLIMDPILKLISRYKPIIFGKHESLDRKEIKDSVIRYHSRIFQAVKNKDSREAYYQMKEHLFTTEANSIKAGTLSK